MNADVRYCLLQPMIHDECHRMPSYLLNNLVLLVSVETTGGYRYL